MSKKIFLTGLLALMSYPSSSFSQDMGQAQADREALSPQAGSTTAPTQTSDGRVYDEGQVQVPREGQVESVHEGQVEAVNPTAMQRPVEEPQPDLFRFESRLFNPIPSD